ncbi:pyridoxamine 5'-phosphate oxidase family protein [candidate division WOR-3 bacterium]|nr:pyridoxamine 5'-phosphate oxidase family protein [candidate division WOR-3 bacterium]
MATKAQRKKEIWKWFKDTQVIYLATVQGRKPQVRPVTMVRVKNKFWVLTGARDAKVRQIKKNNSIQYCLSIKKGKYSGSIRADCRARIIREKKTRRLIAARVPFFKHFWKTPDDPTFALLELVMKQVEYAKPGAFTSIAIKV